MIKIWIRSVRSKVLSLNHRWYLKWLHVSSFTTINTWYLFRARSKDVTRLDHATGQITSRSHHQHFEIQTRVLWSEINRSDHLATCPYNRWNANWHSRKYDGYPQYKCKHVRKVLWMTEIRPVRLMDEKIELNWQYKGNKTFFFPETAAK